MLVFLDFCKKLRKTRFFSKLIATLCIDKFFQVLFLRHSLVLLRVELAEETIVEVVEETIIGGGNHR